LILALALVQKTDEQLLLAIAARDEESLAFLYDKYKVILFSVILRILNNREEAEDVLQEIFLQVWQKAKDFDESRGRGFTWLVTLSRSRAIDRLRALASRQRTADESLIGKSDEVASFEEEAIIKQQRVKIAKVLSELPEEQQIVLQLAYFEGLSQTEISEKLAVPLGTIKTRMRNATIKLRDSFSDRLRALL
jgi:RNA polymerase sigma-70 factor, ECF subfamily